MEDLRNVYKVTELSDTAMANHYLQANWKLLGVFNRSDERSGSSRVVYVLGRTADESRLHDHNAEPGRGAVSHLQDRPAGHRGRPHGAAADKMMTEEALTDEAFPYSLVQHPPDSCRVYRP